MVTVISGTLLITISIVSLLLQRLYSSVPAFELKRLARQGDYLAYSLYRPAAYGTSLRLFLWTIITLALPAGLLMIVPHMPGIVSFMLCTALAVTMFVVVPSVNLTAPTARIAALVAPVVVWVMSYLYPLFSRVSDLAYRYRQHNPHSRLYEKQDLLRLLHAQKHQYDNRITQTELELAQRALTFTDKRAADIVRSSKEVHLVNADDTLGPVLLDRLHKSGQRSCLVYKDTKSNIVGSLHLHDASRAREGGRVFDFIRNDLMYIHEDFTLRQVLAAFQATGQHVAAVVNSFEEFLGTITLDDLIKELLGNHEIGAMNYSNRAVVAAYEPVGGDSVEPNGGAQKQQDANESEKTASPDGTEVVE